MRCAPGGDRSISCRSWTSPRGDARVSVLEETRKSATSGMADATTWNAAVAVAPWATLNAIYPPSFAAQACGCVLLPAASRRSSIRNALLYPAGSRGIRLRFNACGMKDGHNGLRGRRLAPFFCLFCNNRCVYSCLARNLYSACHTSKENKISRGTWFSYAPARLLPSATYCPSTFSVLLELCEKNLPL